MECGVKRENDVVYGRRLDFSKNDHRGLGYFFYEHCKTYSEKILQVDGKTGRSETYSTLLQKSIRTALEMRRMEIKEGDVITICSANNMNSIVPVIAASFLNVAIANLDPSLSLRDAVYLLNLVQPKIIFVEEEALQFAEDIRKVLVCEIELVVMGDTKTTHLSFHQFLKEKDGEHDFIPAFVKDTDCTAVIFFSSGTTGMPKPVKCSHHGLMVALHSMKQAQICSKVCFHISSFYWISAYILTILAAECGGYKVIASKFDVKTFMEFVQKYKITFAFLPTHLAYQFTKENTAGYDASTLENLVFAGAVVHEDRMNKCKSYFPTATVTSGYGQTEASNFITVFSKALTSTLAAKYPGSSGVPIPGTSIKIVDADTEENLPPNTLGEIRLRNNGLFLGYIGEDASKSLDSDGFLKTGDIGYFNEDNCLYICDRIKDMFKYRSWHIVPASVEKIVYQHPAVKDTVVIGVPHEEDGDHPMALVVLKQDYSNINEEDIQGFVNVRVLDRERLRGGVKIMSSLPRTITGKIIRREIREMVKKGKL
ncbi:hypothetical protein Trydic_g16124 [Trypoxylus dichotomus]